MPQLIILIYYSIYYYYCNTNFRHLIHPLQVVKHKLPVTEALQLTGNPTSYQALWKRVNRHNAALKALKAKPPKATPAEVPKTVAATDDSTTISTLTPPRNSAQRKNPPENNPTSKNNNQKKGKNKNKNPTSSKPCESDIAINESLADLQGWIDKAITNETLTRRKKRTPAQVTRDHFRNKSIKQYNNKRYKEAFKMASVEYASNLQTKVGQRGCGARMVCSKYNNSHLFRQNDKKLTPSMLHKYVVELGKVGESPLRKGRPSILPDEITKALATHATMMQVSAEEGEASGQKMLTMSRALKIGTEWEGKFTDEWAWRKARADHPEILNPVKAKNHEDRRAEWLTYNNINEWTDGAKAFMIKHEFVLDEPGHM